MKKQLSLAMAGAMALSLAACGGSTASSAATSTSEAASTVESTAESTEAAAEGDVLDQAAAAAFAQDVTLTMWGAEEDQDLLREISDKFIEKNGNYGGTITINLGVQSESEAKDTVLTDPTAAADVYAFADDQLNELVKAGALQEVQLNADDVKSRNTPASVDAATLDGKLYAYPLTADNGYFMFYDKSFFTEDDVKSLDTMMEKAAAAGKKVSMDVANGWYLYSFYAGAGLNLGLADDGVNTVCNWNEAPGADVTQAIIDICQNPGFIALKDEEFTGKLKDGTLVAGVNGTWRANDAAEVWGDNYAACKLPTYTLNGEQVQMASFSGFKLIGVNPHSANVGAAMLLADFVTNEENEELRFQERAQGPSNITALAAASSPALTAVVEQSEYATLQRVGGNYWASAETLGSICVNGNPDGKDTQALVDDAVAGITAPVTQ